MKIVLEKKGEFLFMQQKQWRIKGLVGLIVLMILAVVIISYNQFDPAAFTQAMLDASYKNKTEEYRKVTGADQAEAHAMFENNLDKAMAQFTSVQLTDELAMEYQSLFEMILKRVNYTVGDAVKAENGEYAVSVIVKPILLFTETYEIFQMKAQEYATNISNRVMSGEAMPSEKEMQEQLYQIYYEILKENVEEGLLYGEPVTVVLHIYKQKAFTYEIREEDLQILDEVLISEKKPET